MEIPIVEKPGGTISMVFTVLASGVAAALVAYAAAFLSVSRLELVSDGPRGKQVLRFFPNQTSYEFFRPLWRVELLLHEDRDACYLVK
jgi:hypothetical protein